MERHPLRAPAIRRGAAAHRGPQPPNQVIPHEKQIDAARLCVNEGIAPRRTHRRQSPHARPKVDRPASAGGPWRLHKLARRLHEGVVFDDDDLGASDVLRGDDPCCYRDGHHRAISALLSG